jgi:hypothetical protein
MKQTLLKFEDLLCSVTISRILPRRKARQRIVVIQPGSAMIRAMPVLEIFTYSPLMGSIQSCHVCLKLALSIYPTSCGFDDWKYILNKRMLP